MAGVGIDKPDGLPFEFFKKRQDIRLGICHLNVGFQPP